MEKFTVLQATALPLLRDNIDTDTIIRVEPLFDGTPREALGGHCFAGWRYRPDGTPEPGFALNQARFAGAQILIAGANFGCGSSREGAVWALMAAGFRCIVAAGFGDIFFGNCFQNGVLPVRLSADAVQALAAQVEADPGARLTVDLDACRLRRPDGGSETFHVPAPRRQALLQGLDGIAATLVHEAAIDAWQRRDAVRRPWIHATSTKVIP